MAVFRSDLLLARRRRAACRGGPSVSLARAVRVDARVRGDIMMMADLEPEAEDDGDYRILHTGL